MSETITTKKEAAPKKFGKAQLMASAQFKREEKYFLEAILDDGKEYSVEEAKKLLEKEMKRKVK